MASRGDYLIVQAAAAAGIDFREFDSSSDKWYRRLHLITKELDRRNSIELYEQQLHAALASLAWASKESAEKLHGMADGFIQQLLSLRYPELGEHDEKEEKKKRSAVDSSAWQSQFGSLDDPETLKRIDAFAASMELLMEATAKQSAMQSPFGRHMRDDKEVSLTRGIPRDA